MRPMERCDVCIRGAGAVGAALALALARQGLQVAIVDTSGSSSVAPAGGQGAEVRTYALNAASRGLLEALKVWPALPPEAVTAVHDMRIHGDAAAGALDFSSWQQTVEALAWIVDAAELDAALQAALRFAPHVHRVSGPVAADLVVWADGKASSAPAELGVKVQRHPYGHTAIVARLETDRPHAHTAWQWFRSPDVLALLPFDRPSPGHGFGLVWSLPAEDAKALLALADEEFNARLVEASGGAAGGLRLVGPRVPWPLMLARAQPLCGAGWVLVGDAAHVVHPLAGQGLNLGLADVVSLARVVAGRESWRPLGDEALLRRHVRERAWPTTAMAGLTDGLLHLFASDHAVVRELRNRGMGLFNRLAPLKRLVTARALDA